MVHLICVFSYNKQSYNLHSIIFKDIVIHCHKDDIDSNTESDEEFCEGIKDQHCQTFTNPDPDPGTVPNAEQVEQF